MKWAKTFALTGSALLLLVVSDGQFRSSSDGTRERALPLLSLEAAHAGGLGDVFGEKGDATDESNSDEATTNESGSDGTSASQADKDDKGSGGLADVFGKKDDNGGSSGPYTTEPQKPPSHSTYSSYEDYPEAYPRPRPRADSLPSVVGLDSFQAVLEDITLSWLKSDVSYLAKHLPPDNEVRVYRGDHLLKTVSSQQFLDSTREAFGTFKTISFSFGKPHFEGNDLAFCPAEHLFAGPDGVARRAQVGYELQRVSSSSRPSERASVSSAMTTEPSPPPSEWVIRSMNQDISELTRSRCFIATAAYGSPLAGEVQTLREFRDRYLLHNRPGRLFVHLYYRLSPPLARQVARNPALAAEVRLFLRPIVRACHLLNVAQ